MNIGEYAENEVRKDFTVSERVAIGKAVEIELGERRGGDQKSNVEISTLDPNEGKRTDEIAAEKAGFGSKDTYRQAKKVLDQGSEELIQKVDAGEISVSAAAKMMCVSTQKNFE